MHENNIKREYISAEKYVLITEKDSIHEQLYQQLLTKKYSAEYYIGVKTTNICCRFGCKAGPPLKQNVIFSKRLYDLIALGMRECKICMPLSYESNTENESVLNTIQLSDFPEKKLFYTSSEATIWVQKQHHCEFLRYICLKRVNFILQNKKNSNHSNINILFYQRYWTPIGAMIACYSNNELYLLEFGDRKMLETELEYLQKKFKCIFKRRHNGLSKKLCKQLNEYFSGVRREFTIPLKMIGNTFQISVLNALINIPYSKTVSYKEQAKAISQDKAVRAVANANGRNTISIIIPCHRVVGSNGTLIGYGGGLERKKFLLNLESYSQVQLSHTPNLVYNI